MREIKFRAWHQAGLSKPEDNRCSMTYWKLGQGLDNSWFYAHAKAIMQYTGLKDKNGVEIYEGDIVTVTTNHIADLAPDKPDTTSTVEVKFERAMFLFGDMTMNYGGLARAKLEVIGNIYENKGEDETNETED